MTEEELNGHGETSFGLSFAIIERIETIDPQQGQPQVTDASQQAMQRRLVGYRAG